MNELCASMEKAAMKGDLEGVRDLRTALGQALSDAQARLQELTQGIDA